MCSNARWGTARRKHRFPYCYVIAVFRDFCGSTNPAWRKHASVFCFKQFYSDLFASLAVTDHISHAYNDTEMLKCSIWLWFMLMYCESVCSTSVLYIKCTHLRTFKIACCFLCMIFTLDFRHPSGKRKLDDATAGYTTQRGVSSNFCFSYLFNNWTLLHVFQHWISPVITGYFAWGRQRPEEQGIKIKIELQFFLS
jgi:hypothetical protein